MDGHEYPTVSSVVPASGGQPQQHQQPRPPTARTAGHDSASDTTTSTKTTAGGGGTSAIEDGSKEAESVMSWSSTSSTSSSSEFHIDDDDDDEDDFLQTESSLEAAALVTYQQMLQGKPILLGRNQHDQTCNVQLPSGRVIVVESNAFPEFKPPAKPNKSRHIHDDVLAQKKNVGGENDEEDYERPPSLLQDPQWRRYCMGGTAASSSSSAQSGGGGKSKHLPSSSEPAAAASNSTTIRTKRTATVAEIAQAIPAAASCVFHIFDRRVNLDQHDDADAASNYALLRAWVQDDPYRVRPIRAAAPTTRIVECNKQPQEQLQQQIHEKKRGMEENNNENHTTMDVIAALKTKPPVSLETLQNEWMSNAKRIKREKTKEFLARDQLAVESLKQRLGINLQ